MNGTADGIVFYTNPQSRGRIVRWMLEEVGQPYETRPVAWESFKEPAHLARNPFAQIPTYEEGGLTLFESGAILIYLAEKAGRLLPAAPSSILRKPCAAVVAQIISSAATPPN